MRTALITLLLIVLVGSMAATAQHTHKHDAAIGLNNGQKWTVDAGTLASVNDMEKEVAGFDGRTVAEYNALAARLKKHINQLTANCTMKGKAHDELHKWLLPYIDTVNQLAKAKMDKDAAGVYQHLATSFAEFHRYFE